MTLSSVAELVRKRARTQPDTVAYTFIDYEVDPAGFAESITWAQTYRRVQAVAEELLRIGEPGDRAAILAPQGLDYVVGFLGALHAGFIAVPLSAPQFGAHDERVTSVLRDSSPAVVLTTSAVVDEVVPYADAESAHPAPEIVEIDALALEPSIATDPVPSALDRPAYLQFTSGSTRLPAGVMVSDRNVVANLEQVVSDYFGGLPPEDTTIVSWLPLYHDMGLIFGICAPFVVGRSAVLLSPMAFLQRPARWMQLLARYPCSFSAAPNFAFELAVRRTSDDDMAGLDLAHVLGIISGAERIHTATLRRFAARFAPFNLSEAAVRPSYGLAEATVYVATAGPGQPPKMVRFDYDKLSAGQAERCTDQAGGSVELVSYGPPRSSTVRIVDPDGSENPAGAIGEIWVHGENVAMGYWRNPRQTQSVFRATLPDATPETALGPWLRTGDLGVMSDGELFIVGRIKDLLIVDGRNHYPDDIEATIQEITGGRVAAISIPDERTEQLVAIIELKKRGNTQQDVLHRLNTVKREVTSAISQSHSVRVADLVLVPPGSIPITTSGKVRRAACAERYRLEDFIRLDVHL
ncbi:AMP-binding protein [Mycobacterium sp.]|uniref:AMP-binding protein n=1 Tax=Mycobacterium sp. TaxID=1785 RepID=UPI002C0D0447|nr:AMP-binding protein [Mycobacterium sp.]HTH85479.1 AMP-binding protein [Mycobacterium sp.]